MKKTLSAVLTGAVLFSPVLAQAKGKEPEPSSPEEWGKADTIQIAKAPDVSPVSSEEILACLDKGVNFLLENQNKNGSWGDHTNGGNWSIWSPYSIGPRTFRTASTALCIMGLESSPRRGEPAVQEAIRRAEDFLLEEMPKLKRSDSQCVYSSWAHAYVLEALAMRGMKFHKESVRYKQLKECAELQAKCLSETASPHGGWGYIVKNDNWTVRPDAQVTSFMTATVLFAAKMGKDVFGVELSRKVYSRGMRFLQSQRTPAGTYLYSEAHRLYPMNPINRHTGSLARSPACDLAIKVYEPEKISTRQMVDDLERLWSRSGWLEMALKKPKPHESFASNSGYFYYYGYYYVSYCLDYLPKEVLGRHASYLANSIIVRQEEDGSWWDNQLYNYHKFYGTGYAMVTMSKAWNALYGEKAS